MALSDSERFEAARALADAERDAKPIDPLTERWPRADVEDAYEIQRANIAARIEEGGVVRGHKVGLSSRAMQEMMGVDESDYGHLMDDMFVFEGDTIETSGLCLPRVEVEVAFVLGRSLPGRTCHVGDVLRATEFVLPALEIIDSRIRDWKIGLVDTIADNASSCRVVLGGNPVKLTDLEWEQVTATYGGVSTTENAEGQPMRVDGKPVTDAIGTHANSVIVYDVPRDATRFKARGGLDSQGTDEGCGSTVRFGESVGFEQNWIIDDLWPFRDYVIRSINDDKPFDQFIREHVAGDVPGTQDVHGSAHLPRFDQQVDPGVGVIGDAQGLEAHAREPKHGDEEAIAELGRRVPSSSLDERFRR